MKEKAKSRRRRLVLPEGAEPRTMKAAKIIIDESLASTVTLIGRESEIARVANEEGVNIAEIKIVHPELSPLVDQYANEYFEMRKHKGMTEEQARIDIVSPLRWGALMVHLGEADAFVAGAESSTADVLRAALTIIGTSGGLKTASSCFVIQTKEKAMGVNGAFIFSDCAVVPNPTAEQLAEIAIGAAESCREYLNTEPAIAMLSFSTKGSGGDHADVKKVLEALDHVQKKAPALLIDGELQLDAALVPGITEKKSPDSPVKGKVNTLVFPDLDAGNIGYKLVQRLAHAEAFGPFLQGFAKPVSDLSRGASVEDIVVTCAVTLARAK